MPRNPNLEMTRATLEAIWSEWPSPMVMTAMHFDERDTTSAPLAVLEGSSGAGVSGMSAQWPALHMCSEAPLSTRRRSASHVSWAERGPDETVERHPTSRPAL